MSRRPLSQIDPAALRDHADQARVERVWERLEQGLSSRPAWLPRPERRSAVVYLVAAMALGAFAAFGGGLLLGKATWGRRPSAEALLATPVIEKSLVEVLAAGTQLRTFPLEGGGHLTLSPGATVEVERAGSAVTLSLLQGAASIESAGRPLTIVAGEARINTQAGSMLSLTRNAEDLDVNVTDGSVNVTSPAGPQQLGKNQRETVPLHVAVASTPIDAKRPHSRALSPRRPNGPRPTTAKGVGQAEWFTHYPGDQAGALALLQKQGVTAAIDTAHGANELMTIAELMSGKGGDQSARIRALERCVRAFPSDQRASLAADWLAKIYDARGEATLAKDYRDQVQTLAQNATTGSDSLFCDLIRREPDKTKAALSAKEYLAKYPDGECREEFERLVQGDPPAPPAPTAAPALDPTPAATAPAP
jgi:hypothetical protein